MHEDILAWYSACYRHRDLTLAGAIDKEMMALHKKAFPA
jgi:hypothetical protein